jgi:acetyl esterase/lipase
MLDDRTAADHGLDAEKHPLWNNLNNRGGWHAYLGREPGSPYSLPYAVASRRKEYAGLPPAWIGVGDVDLFYKETCEYASGLEAAGVDCDLKIFSGAPHGFNVAAPRATVTKDFHDSIDCFLRKMLDVSAS